MGFVADNFFYQFFDYYIKYGTFFPGEYYYGPIDSDIYNVNLYKKDNFKIPFWKRSDVPVDTNTKGILTGKWYYGPGVRGIRILYCGEPFYYFTDGKNYIGLALAREDGKRYFYPYRNENLNDFRTRAIKHYEMISYNDFIIYWSSEKEGERKMYDFHGYPIYINEVDMIDVDYKSQKLFDYDQIASD